MVNVYFIGVLVPVLFAAVLCLLTFLAAVFYIAEICNERRREAVVPETLEDRRRRHRVQYPSALLTADNFIFDEPVLGNLVIKDEATLVALSQDLVPVDASVFDTNDDNNGHEKNERPNESSSYLGGQEMRVITTGSAAICPRAPIQRDFHTSLMGGGFVIVECRVPTSLSASRGHSEVGALSAADRSEDEALEGDWDEGQHADAFTPHYFRLQRRASPYGRAQYLSNGSRP
ncbi:hypothetical protein ABL78_2835 [Leptomonas seymouri]|uniref:Uncharacterized protein n=1 Tax=Leptomonas seymouri TaxID=5684 RepID=A0A0N0P6V7_LEPSE|nr:hypothetical protein ABL78_2835 [Leptomonas seymouri]|eukprot:KPI88059.1 hypothetical protein ABL78_2835 [Leptomonas seymouri]